MSPYIVDGIKVRHFDGKIVLDYPGAQMEPQGLYEEVTGGSERKGVRNAAGLEDRGRAPLEAGRE